MFGWLRHLFDRKGPIPFPPAPRGRIIPPQGGSGTAPPRTQPAPAKPVTPAAVKSPSPPPATSRPVAEPTTAAPDNTLANLLILDAITSPPPPPPPPSYDPPATSYDYGSVSGAGDFSGSTGSGAAAGRDF